MGATNDREPTEAELNDLVEELMRLASSAARVELREAAEDIRCVGLEELLCERTHPGKPGRLLRYLHAADPRLILALLSVLEAMMLPPILRAMAAAVTERPYLIVTFLDEPEAEGAILEGSFPVRRLKELFLHLSEHVQHAERIGKAEA